MGHRQEVRIVHVVAAADDVRVAGDHHVVADRKAGAAVQQGATPDEVRSPIVKYSMSHTVVPRMTAVSLPIVAPNSRR